MTNKVSANDLCGVKVSQSEFGKLVGVTRARINQLIRAGLIVGDSDGVALMPSLERFYVYRVVKHFCDVQPTDEYFLRFLSKS